MKNKLQSLRLALSEHLLAGFIQPVHDEYMSEYPPASNRRVEWLTGFSGSAGTVVVTRDQAAFFTDGRYTLQAANEVDGKCFAQHNSGTKSPDAWIADMLAPGDRVGYDAKLTTRDMLTRMKKTLDKKAIELVPVANLIDDIWQDQPEAPASKLFIHETQYAGEEPASRRARIAELVKKSGADACVIAAPDSVCWLLNIRGRDTENTPLVLATAIIDSSGAVQLFAQPSRCDEAVRAHLGNSVEICDPAMLKSRLEALGKDKKRVLCDPQSVPLWFTQLLAQSGAVIVDGDNPCMLPKAMKNDIELQGIRSAHIIDGAAVVKLLCWLDGASTNELEVSDKLLALRSQNPLFVEPSFTTIAGSGPNGAIVHYRATKESNRKLKSGELFLLDSGGQYPSGTTDITRTIPIGKPTAEHKDRFTRVLKGHIAIATAVFPEATSGSQLDVLARQYLWQEGLDYDHGTGHGVGCFLGVHEGPQRISKRGGDAPLRPGMIVSNEPGYYKTGEYGIRIENLVTVVQKAQMLGFDTVTCVPIDTRLVETSLMTVAEKDWLNRYHAWVLEKLSPALEVTEQEWLKLRCAII